MRDRTGPKGYFHQNVSALFGRFRRNRDGTTAIEFAALAIPFLLLVFAILENCVSFAGQEVMANATDDIARQFRTGQLKPPLTVQQLKQKICDGMSIVVTSDCTDRVSVDLRTYPEFTDFASLGFQITNKKIVLTKNGTVDPTGFVVQPGPAQSKNMLRVFYAWPVMTDLMAQSMANLDGGATLHFSTTTWQNEPFDN
jgi:Flp pilus assembly protein TadG